VTLFHLLLYTVADVSSSVFCKQLHLSCAKLGSWTERLAVN
jgi:hypothetical protein